MELYIEPIRFQKNKLNGRYLKGHTPFTKGKKWNEYMDMNNAAKMLGNLNRKGNPVLWKTHVKPVIAIEKGILIGFFESGVSASRKLKISKSNITACCKKQRKTAGGMNFFYENDFENWHKLIKND